MTAEEAAPPALAQLSRYARLQLKRELAARCVELGIRVNETTSPGRIALKHDPVNSAQRPHLEAIDDALVKMLAEPNRRQMIFTPPQIGKALALDTPILTDRGWSTIGRLRVGDTVYDRRGAPCRVTWKSPVWEDRECFTVRTGDGESIVASAEHEWMVCLDRRVGERRYDTRTLARIKNAQIITGAATRYVWAEAAPTVPTQCIEVDSRDHTYLAGRTLLPTCNSTRISRWFPFWYLTERPRSRIILASYAASLAVTHGAATRDLVTMYGDDYGLRLKDTEATKASWMLHTGGGMRSVGVRGGLTGQPMDLGIIDDPVKDREQAESPVVRQSVWDWYSSVWSTRKAPEAGEVLVMTRFHKDDLAGRLLDQDGRVEEGGEWHVLHLPALAMTPDPDKGIYPDPLGREPGEPISHPRIDAADIGGLLAHWGRARKAVTNRDWNALYQGMPFDAEGALLSADDVRDHTAPEPETWKRNVVGVDPSGGGRDTAGIVVVGLDREGRGWFRADYTGHMTSYEWPRQACMAAVEFDAERIVVETNFGGDQATTLVAQAWDELERKGHIPAGRLCPLIAAVTARKSKVLRAEPIAQAIKTGRLWFAQGADLKQLTDEWLMWEPGTTWSPGALDAGVYGATEVLPPLPRGAGLANPAKRSRAEVTPIGVAGRRIGRR